MELWIGIGIVFVLVIYFLWSSRRGTSNDLEAQTKGLPDDLPDKQSGHYMGDFNGGGSGSGGGI